MRIQSFLALFAISAALSAQTTLPIAPQATPETHLEAQVQAQAATRQLRSRVAILSASSNGCPVAFTARRAPGGNLVQTRGRVATHTLAFDVSFGTDAEDQDITTARITLHGQSGVRLLPAGPAPDGNATESLSLQLTPGHNAAAHTIAYAHQLTGVISIELNELTYSDGSHWHESPDNPCRISPNGFLPVAAGN